jgi:hypothetical protein
MLMSAPGRTSLARRASILRGAAGTILSAAAAVCGAAGAAKCIGGTLSPLRRFKSHSERREIARSQSERAGSSLDYDRGAAMLTVFSVTTAGA